MLVDLSAHRIVGAYLKDRQRELLYRLARSKILWERRIAIISTFAFIKDGELTDAFALADILLKDDHDLMHKAVGWVLRECGKKNMAALERFLKPRYRTMPRTMLRYAIERLPEEKRQGYLRGKV
jgi:3-methyladenine DNA glycosylase AlkD